MGILDTLLGNDAADASNRAAEDTYRKQLAASGELKTYASGVPEKFAALGSGFTPYAAAGGDALKRLMAGLGLGGGDPNEFTAAYRATPGYEAGLETGGRAVAGNANAGNMLQSGRTLKALQRFGSDYEDQRVGDYFDRLSGVVGVGQGATGAIADLGSRGLTTEAGLRSSAFGGDMNSAGTVGQGMVAGEQAKQSALTNLMSGAAFLGGSYLGGGKLGMPKLQLPGKGAYPSFG